ncbi:MAG: ABC transporter substrate-binding protein [Anaerolineae bacterium]
MSKKKPLSRREFLRTVGIAGAGAFLASCATPEPEVIRETVEVEKVTEKTVEVEVEKTVEVEKVVEVTPTVPMGPVNALGEVLPADALPLEEQYIIQAEGGTGGGYGHIMESLYNRAFEGAKGQEPLTSLDINFEVYGVGCESWEPAEDGSYWDFFLREGLTWSNGEPITANDWVYTLRWSLSNGYDFAWFYFDILNAAAVTAGELPPEELGIEAVDDYTLRIYTEAPVPYLPMVGVWFEVMPEGAQEELGENWALDPDRYVASGPFMLSSFSRELGNLWELRPDYQGIRRPWVTEVRTSRELPSGLPAYMAGEVHNYSVGVGNPPAEIGLVNANPVLRAESHPRPPTFTDYLGFNTLGDFEPLADPNVRLAMCKAIDKSTIVSQIYQGFSHTAWGILPKGFPNYNPDLEQLDPNIYDPEAAAQLLADAGYPDGAGFPTYELYIRQPNAQQTAVCEAMQAQWRENLGINVELRPSDFQSFTSAAFSDRTAAMYYVGYAQDYADPATFLNVFRNTGRHPHDNPEWTEFYNEVNSSFDPDERMAGLKEAEQMLVESAAWFFVAHPFSIDLWPCNAQGYNLEPNKDGYRMWGGGGIGCPHAFEGIYWADSDCREGLT